MCNINWKYYPNEATHWTDTKCEQSPLSAASQLSHLQPDLVSSHAQSSVTEQALEKQQTLNLMKHRRHKWNHG